MTIAGIGVEFTIPSVMYGVAILLVNWIYFPSLTFTLGSPWVNIVLGVVVITLGFVMVRKALIILPYIKTKQLCTEGLYAKIRNPIYFAWIVIIIPGLVIVIGLFLAFTIPLFMYIVFRIYIHREEDYLELLFGEAYRDYKKSTPRLFPAFK